MRIDPAYYGDKTRTETLSFKVELDKAGADRHEKSLRRTRFGDSFDWLRDGDSLKVDYSCKLDYFGDVERNLQLLEALVADEAVVVDADFEEMRQGHSVLANLVATVARIRERLARRKLDAAVAEKTLASFDECQARIALESALRSLKETRPAVEQAFLEWAAAHVEAGMHVPPETGRPGVLSRIANWLPHRDSI